MNCPICNNEMSFYEFTDSYHCHDKMDHDLLYYHNHHKWILFIDAKMDNVEFDTEKQVQSYWNLKAFW